MNEQTATIIVDDYYNSGNKLVPVYNYCVHKGKDKDLSEIFTKCLLLKPSLLNELAEEVIHNIIEEFNIILLHDENYNFIKSYINKQTNGKEIYKV